MNAQIFMNKLDQIAPLMLAEPWDKVGFLLGDDSQIIRKALVCVDLTPAVLDEADNTGCQWIVAYHPLIFQPVSRLTRATWKERVLADLLQKQIGVYSPHTALDAVRGGLSDQLAQAVGTGQSRPLIAKSLSTPALCKIVVFVPSSHLVNVRQALANVGAGAIGNYRECSFESIGTGGFLPVDGANPHLGKVGTRETVEEVKLEMVFDAFQLDAVVAAMREAHPYEEPAFDLLQLLNTPQDPYQAPGTGRMLELDVAVSANELASRLKTTLGVGIRMADGGRPIKTVAICPGSGGSLFEKVDADAYVTGEMQHHQILDLQQSAKTVLLSGHTHCERPLLATYVQSIADACQGQVEVMQSQADKAPWQWLA